MHALRANAPALLALACLSVVTGIAAGWLHNVDQPLGLLRRLGMTQQSSHATVWQGALYERRMWVLVHVASGGRILGWPEQFSDTPEEGSLFLTHAAYLDQDDQLTEIHGPGILLTRESGIRMIEFLEAV